VSNIKKRKRTESSGFAGQAHLRRPPTSNPQVSNTHPAFWQVTDSIPEEVSAGRAAFPLTNKHAMLDSSALNIDDLAPLDDRPSPEALNTTDDAMSGIQTQAEQEQQQEQALSESCALHQALGSTNVCMDSDTDDFVSSIVYMDMFVEGFFLEPQQPLVKSQRSNSRGSNTPGFWPVKGTIPDEVSTGRAAPSLGSKHVTVDPSVLNVDDITPLEKIQSHEALIIVEDIMTGIQKQTGQGQQPIQVLPPLAALYSPALSATRVYGDSNTDVSLGSTLYVDKFVDGFSATLANPQSDHVEATRAPDRSEEKNRNRFSFQNLTEVFRDRSRPASYPRRSMRRSVQLGIQKLSQWLEVVHVDDYLPPERRSSIGIMGF
jgi:hypothetical protein